MEEDIEDKEKHIDEESINDIERLLKSDQCTEEVEHNQNKDLLIEETN